MKAYENVCQSQHLSIINEELYERICYITKVTFPKFKTESLENAYLLLYVFNIKEELCGKICYIIKNSISKNLNSKSRKYLSTSVCI